MRGAKMPWTKAVQKVNTLESKAVASGFQLGNGGNHPHIIIDTPQGRAKVPYGKHGKEIKKNEQRSILATLIRLGITVTGLATIIYIGLSAVG